MEKSIVILETIKKNRAEIEKAEEIISSSPFSARKKDAALIAIGEKAENLKIENQILKDNARRAYYAEVMPAALEIINSYAGKSYGEKTKEKIRQALISRANCSVYITASRYTDSITLVPLNENGFSGTMFNYGEFEIYTKGENGDRKKIITDNNKIQALTMEDLYLSDCAEYVDDVPARAAEIKKAYFAIQAAEEALKTACDAFNVLLPRGIDRMYSNNTRNYLLRSF
jgi:hypothetical protein